MRAARPPGPNSPAPVGCVAVEMNGANACMITMLAVAPEVQTAALGRALLADAEKLAANSGAALAKITVVQQRDRLV